MWGDGRNLQQCLGSPPIAWAARTGTNACRWLQGLGSLGLGPTTNRCHIGLPSWLTAQPRPRRPTTGRLPSNSIRTLAGRDRSESKGFRGQGSVTESPAERAGGGRGEETWGKVDGESKAVCRLGNGEDAGKVVHHGILPGALADAHDPADESFPRTRPIRQGAVRQLPRRSTSRARRRDCVRGGTSGLAGIYRALRGGGEGLTNLLDFCWRGFPSSSIPAPLPTFFPPPTLVSSSPPLPLPHTHYYHSYCLLQSLSLLHLGHQMR